MKEQNDSPSLSNYLENTHCFVKTDSKLISLAYFLFLDLSRKEQLEFLCIDFYTRADKKELMNLRR